MARLCGCAGLSEVLLLADMVNNEIYCSGSFITRFLMNMKQFDSNLDFKRHFADIRVKPIRMLMFRLGSFLCSHEHEVLTMGYWDQSMSVVRRRQQFT